MPLPLPYHQQSVKDVIDWLEQNKVFSSSDEKKKFTRSAAIGAWTILMVLAANDMYGHGSLETLAETSPSTVQLQLQKRFGN